MSGQARTAASRPTRPSTPALERAHEAAALLRQRHPELLGVVVYGSVACGSEERYSDIDLLAVTSSRSRRDQLIKTVRQKHGDQRFSIALLSVGDLSRRITHSDAFLAHVATEGRLIWERDHAVSSVLSRLRHDSDRLRAQLEMEPVKLSSFRDLAQFNGVFRLCLAQLFGIGKAVSILRVMLDRGTPVFAPQEVFAELRRIHPELERAIRSVEVLSPFWSQVRGRSHEPLPFSDVGAEGEAAASGAIRAIDEIAGV